MTKAPTPEQLEQARQFGALTTYLKQQAIAHAKTRMQTIGDAAGAHAMNALIRAAWEIAKAGGPKWEELFMRTVALTSGSVLNAVPKELIDDGHVEADAGPTEVHDGGPSADKGEAKH